MYLILDVESTCWEKNSDDWKKFKDESEIIEIGAVLVGSNFRLISEFRTFVRPELNPILSSYCKELTGITQEDVNEAASFSGILVQLQSWLGCWPEKVTFCSWGYYDKKMFETECKRHNIEYPFGNHISLKHEFARRNGLKPIGMTKVLDMLGIELEGEHHRALDDAKNITKIFIEEWGK